MKPKRNDSDQFDLAAFRELIRPLDNRKELVQSGKAVVASLRPSDKPFTDWAKQQGLLLKVDRSSEWGNPFAMAKESERVMVCQAFERYLADQPGLLTRVGELRGRVLACWCYPKRCHADHLANLANRSL